MNEIQESGQATERKESDSFALLLMTMNLEYYFLSKKLNDSIIYTHFFRNRLFFL